MKLTAGERLGDWVIEKPLGAGGMGSVYLAHSALSEAVKAAVKVLEPSDLAEIQQRFIQEMKTLAALNHPAIVRVLGGGRDDARGLLYMAMELVDGEDLEARLRRGPLSVDEARALFGPVADALAYAHEKGTAHRDIKPGNLMIRKDGTPVVVDFGIAVVAGQTRHTKAGMVPGTVMYMPPELFEGLSPQPRATDAYALGVVLWESLTGRQAFQGDPESSESQQMAQIMGLKLRTDALDPGDTAPHALRDVIRRTTDPEPGSRLVDLRQVRQQILGDTPLDQIAPLDTMDFALDGPPPPPRKRGWGRVVGIGVLLIGLLSLGGLVLGTLVAGAGAAAWWASTGTSPAPRPPVALEASLAQAGTALTSGDLAQARVSAGLALDDHPEDPSANLMYGQVLLADGDLLLARPYLCAALAGGLAEAVPGQADGTLDCDRGPGASLPLTSPMTVASLDLSAQAAASRVAVEAARSDDAVAQAESAAAAPARRRRAPRAASAPQPAPAAVPAPKPAPEPAPAAAASRSADGEAAANPDEIGRVSDNAEGVTASGASAPRRGRADIEELSGGAPAASAPARSSAARSAPAGPAVAMIALRVVGELDRATVQRALDPVRRAALTCHADAPHLSGRLVLTFTIRSDGTLWGRTEVVTDTVGGDIFTCIDQVLMAQDFPRDYGGNTSVTWTLDFGS